MEFYPLKFEPIYKEKIWGGRGLSRLFQRDLPGEMIGESWELAAHYRGTSTVANGPFRGAKITGLVEKYPLEILGRTAVKRGQKEFPLLVKFIDANDKLSIQVHPDDDYTRDNPQEEGKTEMWYILSARPGARIIYGLNPGTDRDTLAAAVRDDTLHQYLRQVEVNAGDVFFIPPGTVHALGRGIILAEIQQNSDTTYRIYDYNRIDQEGKPRPLHLEKALDVIDFQDQPEANRKLVREGENLRRSILNTCPYFIVEKIELFKREKIRPADSFYILVILSGRGELRHRGYSCQLLPGSTILLPAALEEVTLSGRVDYLQAYLPPAGGDIQDFLLSRGFSAGEVSSFTGAEKK